MIDESLISAISSVGVPAVLALYCLITLNKTVESMAHGIEKLTDRIDTLIMLVGHNEETRGKHAA